jgi:hypothetical protein
MVGGKNFQVSMSFRPDLGYIQPLIQRVPGALSPGVKQSGREADHSPPTSTDVEKTWVYTYHYGTEEKMCVRKHLDFQTQ